MENLEIQESEAQELVHAYAKKITWLNRPYYLYNGLRCPEIVLRNIITFRRHFQAKDTDYILATMPKSGTTWLIALAFSIINRNDHPLAESPLLTTNPHDLVPFVEYHLHDDAKTPNLENTFRPKIFSTHLNYNSLNTSILGSKCRIVYICRNPLDLFVSYWHFLVKNSHDKLIQHPEPLFLDEALESFCQGNHSHGPFWEHMLGYWNASLKDPQKVLFLKYEDLKANPVSEVKKIAEFLGLPFSEEEIKNGLVEEIVKLCSFDNLKNLEVNKSGETRTHIKFSSLFRKGEIGDWVNYVSPSKAQLLQKVMDEKFGKSGLVFDRYCDSNE